jgi:hypothetical protein
MAMPPHFPRFSRLFLQGTRAGTGGRTAIEQRKSRQAGHRGDPFAAFATAVRCLAQQGVHSQEPLGPPVLTTVPFPLDAPHPRWVG